MTATSTDSRGRPSLNASERRDPVTGVVERLSFVGAPAEQIFTVTAVPSGPVLGGVVMAPSLLTDRIRLYRGEVRAARRLAALGYAVVRFDYRGFGHSDGFTGDTNVHRLTADLDLAIASLREVVSEGPITLIGSRFGSLMVANSATPVSRAVLWDPVLTGREYFRTAFRAHLIGGMQRDGSSQTPSAQLKEGGRATVLGYTVTSSLVDSVDGLSLTAAPALSEASVLWIESEAELSKGRSEAETNLRAAVTDLSVRLLPNPDSGWFVGVRPFDSQEAEDAIVEWLTGLEER